MPDSEPIDPRTAEILGISKTDRLGSVKNPVLPIPTDVQEAFMRDMNTEGAMGGIPERLFAVLSDWKNPGGINRVYFGYSEDSEGNFNFTKRVELRTEEGENGSHTPKEINWYDEQGKEILLALEFIANYPRVLYHMKFGDKKVMIRWYKGPAFEKDKLVQKDREELDWFGLNGQDMSSGVFESMYKGESKIGSYPNPWETKGHHVDFSFSSIDDMSVDYYAENEKVQFVLKENKEPAEKIIASRFPDFQTLMQELFPQSLLSNPKSTNVDLDQKWKDNNTVNELLGVQILPIHPSSNRRSVPR